MIDEPGWAIGEHDFIETAARPEPSQRMLLAMLKSVTATARRFAGAIDQAVAVGIGLEVVLGLDERDAGFPWQATSAVLRRTWDAC